MSIKPSTVLLIARLAERNRAFIGVDDHRPNEAQWLRDMRRVHGRRVARQAMQAGNAK